MTNFEKYKDFITKWGSDFMVDAIDGQALECGGDIGCERCVFTGESTFNCNAKKIRWLCEEYKAQPLVDWGKVPIDSKVLVSDDGENWHNGYYAGVSYSGSLMAWEDGRTSWSTEDGPRLYEYVKLAENIESCQI